MKSDGEEHVQKESDKKNGDMEFRLRQIRNMLILLFVASCVIFVASTIVEKIGEVVLGKSTGIEQLASGNEGRYIFYSQAEDSVELYPWNYYEDSRMFQQEYGKEIYASDMFDIDELYSNITYYFYKMLPEQVRIEVYNEDKSLSQRMDYNHIEEKLFVKFVNGNPIYFYEDAIDILGEMYIFKFSFDKTARLLSFELYAKEMVWNEELQIYEEVADQDFEYEKNQLTTYFNESDNIRWFEIYYDIYYMANETIDYSFDPSRLEYTFEEIEEDSYAIADKEYVSEIVGGIQSTSYQIVEAKNELLIIFLDNNFVLHYNPVTKMIQGFHTSNL